MMGIGMDAIAAHESALRDYAQARLAGLNWLNVQGNAPGKGAIFSFSLNGAAHPHDISTILDQRGIAVRAGQHCAAPLMAHLGVNATCRASFAMYNTNGRSGRAGRCAGILSRPVRLEARALPKLTARGRVWPRVLHFGAGFPPENPGKTCV
jgi:hypothetical protein